MSNETKRDVFDETVKRLYDSANYEGLDIDAEFRRKGTTVEWELQTRYAAALPDNLPVIPKAVGCMIIKMKPICKSILDSQYRDYGKDHRWIIDHYDTFARAWLLGVWCVEGTGEIVKLEEEK